MLREELGVNGGSSLPAALRLGMHGLDDPFREGESKMLVQDGSSALTQLHFCGASMLIDVREQRQAESRRPFGRISVRIAAL